jgi:hypothetical protein
MTSVEWMVVNNELERAWKEAFVVLFKTLSCRFPEETKRCRKYVQNHLSEPSFEQDLPEFKLEATQSKPTFSFSHEPVILM